MSESSSDRGHERDLDQGQLESIELLNEGRRRLTADKLESACCEMALALVYSDGSTQLRETGASAKVCSDSRGYPHPSHLRLPERSLKVICMMSQKAEYCDHHSPTRYNYLHIGYQFCHQQWKVT